jgi:hypothetical protein
MVLMDDTGENVAASDLREAHRLRVQPEIGRLKVGD